MTQPNPDPKPRESRAIPDNFVLLCDTPAELQAALQYIIKEVRPSPMPGFRLEFQLPRRYTSVMRAFFDPKTKKIKP